jgi:type II secretory pathway pseudopilin PulG
VLVLAIMAIVTAMAVPRYSSSISRYRADAAARRIASDLEMAQSRAYSRNTMQSVIFSIGSNSYEVVGISDLNHPAQPYVVRLNEPPYSATLKAVNFGGESTVSFDAFGQPMNAGSVVVSVGSEQRTVTLDPSSARAKIK